MTSQRLFAAVALSLAAAAGAHAETYEGVQAPVAARSRAEVQAEAVKASGAPNQNVSSASLVQASPTAPRDRVLVQAEAVRAAAAPDQNVSSGSRVNSRVISTMENPADVRARAQGNAASRL
ncbi:MAG: DUF4148 domain-containing protein [Xenophilus sp.]